MYVSNYKIIKFVINFTLISVVSILHLHQFSDCSVTLLNVLKLVKILVFSTYILCVNMCSQSHCCYMVISM